ncbi:hypothetical protein A0H81_05299 [Grifola frondosa]|uniref:Uncharacterized protein n=1 Tax=Grifola frondosa TaxID=5627 RepID=A0A1C7MF67_GRIFR|nr:hypothetical protein A0H81_05299 [Grifola frondosa]
MSKAADMLLIHLKAAYARITLTPFTLAFFLLSFVHCIAQGLTAALLHSEDADAFAFVTDILHAAQVPPNEVPRLYRTNGNLVLKLCTAIPLGDVSDQCITIYDTSSSYEYNASVSARCWDLDVVRDLSTRSMLVTRNSRESVSDIAALIPVPDSTGSIAGVNLTLNDDAGTVFLSEQCARILEYPNRILDNSRREDLALIGSQFWLLCISTFGILYNSIPHVLAAVFTRMLQTTWSMYTLWRTQDVEFRVNSLIVDPSTPCHFNILPTYFSRRTALQIPDLVLNCTALSSTAFLAWRIVKAYSGSTFRRVGPPPSVMRLYKFFLVHSMLVQLSLFFTVTAVSLWMDQLINSEIALLSRQTPVYDALFIFTIIVHHSSLDRYGLVRRAAGDESSHGHLHGHQFHLHHVLVGMFFSPTYRWTFIEWPFFACATLAAEFVLLGAAVFGIVCWTGFEKGLAHYCKCLLLPLSHQNLMIYCDMISGWSTSPVHVEAVLTQSDFSPEMFTNDAERADNHTSRCPTALADPSLEGVSVLKRDHNWNFSDVDRPRIYMVDFQDVETNPVFKK